jgi:hypothetical protein
MGEDTRQTVLATSGRIATFKNVWAILAGKVDPTNLGKMVRPMEIAKPSTARS